MRTAGYLVAGVGLLVTIVVFLPRRIGREGSGDSLDPRTWKRQQGLTGSDEAFLGDESGKPKTREQGLQIRTRPKSASDHYVAPVQRPAWPHTPPEVVRKAWAALRSLRVKLEAPESAKKFWGKPEAGPPDGVPRASTDAGAPGVDQVAAELAVRWRESGGPELTVRLPRLPWAELSRRSQDRARAALAGLGGECRGDEALARIAAFAGGSWRLEEDGAIAIVGPREPDRRDPELRRWIRLQAVRGTPGEETPPAWRVASELALREGAVAFECEQEPIARALEQFSRATGLSAWLDESLGPEVSLQPVTLRVKQLPPGELLRLLLDPLELAPGIEPDGLVVGETGAVAARTGSLQAPYATAEAILARPVKVALADFVPYKLAAAIEQMTGTTVVVDESLWGSEEPLEANSGARPLRIVLEEVARLNGLAWRVYEGEIYLAR